MPQVRCPNPACATFFEVDMMRLGRNVPCPECASSLTARPVEVEEQLRAQEDRITGSPGAAVDRLPLSVLVDSVRSLWNVGSIFRTADACGVDKMILCGITGRPPRPEIAKTALGAQNAVAWRYRADPMAALATLREDGYVPVALERTDRAVPLSRMAWPARVCLVIGSEVAGISPPVLAACPSHVSIPMRGVKDSLNVAVAFGIAAHAAATSLAQQPPC